MTWRLLLSARLGGQQPRRPTYSGGQIRSFLSLVSYFGKGKNRESYLGVKNRLATSRRTTASRLKRSRTSWRIGYAARMRLRRATTIGAITVTTEVRANTTIAQPATDECKRPPPA
jgi:hypothetical protein